MENRYYVGIDMDDENAVVSFFGLQMKEPETVSTVAGSEVFQIPLLLAKKRGIGKWYIGEEAKEAASRQEEQCADRLLEKAVGQENIVIEGETYPAKELLALYIKKLLSLAGKLLNPQLPDKLVISLEKLSREVTELFMDIAEYLGLTRNQVSLIDRKESFYYFVYSQKEELWRHDVALFDYRENRICCRRLVRSLHTVPQLITLTEQIYETEHKLKDEGFLSLLQESFRGKIISSAYLVGDGFEGDWMKLSLSFLCKGRRAFIGKNMYSKGACYAAAVKDYQKEWPYVYMGDNEMKVNVSLKLRNLENMEFYTLINAGDNWYEAVGECEIILSGTPEIDFWMQLPDSKEAKIKKLTLADLPERPPKTTRLRITAKPLSDTKVQIKLKDLGFGELFQSSDKSWEYVMSL